MITRTSKVIDLHHIVTEQVVGTVDQLDALATNPNTRAMVSPRRVGPDLIKVTVTRVEPAQPPRPRRRLPVTIHGGRRYALALALTFGVPGLLFGTGWLTFTLWGDQISHAIATFLAVGAAFLSAAAIGSVVIAVKGGGCPGLHCPGCGNH